MKAPGGVLLLLCWLLGSCASPSSIGFTKVKYYHLKEEENLGASDPMIDFERKYYLYGAVDQADLNVRVGNYYTFFWSADPAKGPVKLRFEYRNAPTGEAVHRLEYEIADVRKTNRTLVNVTGPVYLERGPVVAWRATLWQGGRSFGSTQSYLWD
ncbi:MAG: hypothetical protein AAF514_13585 [Verrucomicrobiota bacterium]